MFTRQLLKLKGISCDMALAIVAIYPTPKLLRMAYAETIGSNGEKLLTAVEYGKPRKKVGPVVSKTVHQLYTLLIFK